MHDTPLRILLVDDDPVSTEVLRARLEGSGNLEVGQVDSGQEALTWLARSPWDAVVSDVMMPGMDGIELVREVRAQDPSLPVFLVTGRATVRKAVEGIRAGATDFLPKPVDVEALRVLLERAVAERPVREELSRRARAGGDGSSLAKWFVGSHPRLRELERNVERIARLPRARVLITGESGTGKSALARAIHHISGSTGRFVAVNCAALPGTLLESELFGHEKGAFTDAREMKRGLIELARHGTLFLDEIGAMPLELQGKLLLFLEDRQIRRVGGTETIPAEAHVVAATNEDLQRRVAERTFRADLLYRLDVATLRMPSLREMPSVIPELALHFARELAEESGLALPEVDDASFAGLEACRWPGNARELRNAVERALIYHEGGPLRVGVPEAGRMAWAGEGEADGPMPGMDSPVPGMDRPSGGATVHLPLDLPLQEVERRYLEAQLKARADMDLKDVAECLGISRKTLWEKRKRYDLD
jgi:two-component system, NtrC family, response regulator AtoC